MRNRGGRWVVRVALLCLLAAAPAGLAAMPARADVNAAGQVLLAAGDVANCGADPKNHFDANKAKGVAAVAALIQQALPANGRVAALGDLAYDFGSPDQFHYCYDRYWGAFKSQTYPAAGNHEYYDNCNPHSVACDAAPYFAYFGNRAGAPGAGYYSYDYGGWHIVVLNSNGSEPSGDACGWIACNGKSPQGQWLKQDLAHDTAKCTLAYWHHPRFSSGAHGDNPEVQPFWKKLAKAGVDVVLNGHSHDYERFAPMNAKGKRNPKAGMREFVVGTGG
ncbi:MAG TPA: metallophosphoesterase, partial [Thermomicrobiales bacterium]|nr:metallophosphoesterase [Thermomicrobiales bacterium]